jgi:hypothetical protein
MTAAISVPTNRRERLFAALALAPRRQPVRTSHPLVRLLLDVLGDEPYRFDIHHDRDQDGRERVLAFLFNTSGKTPVAVAKVQNDTRNGSLRDEAAALTRVRALVPETLHATIPEVVRVHVDGTEEVLVISALPGRSAWFEVQASLVPSLRAALHFSAAAQWLADFHNATERDAQTTAAHGDFWPNNLLCDTRMQRVGVLDWEHFAETSSRFVDLFQFPLTYGLGFPWRRYAKLDAEAAFEKTFAEKNRVSAAVRAYFATYCEATGLEPVRLGDAFRDYLAAPHAHPGLRGLPWTRFRACFDAARQSVFS